MGAHDLQVKKSHKFVKEASFRIILTLLKSPVFVHNFMIPVSTGLCSLTLISLGLVAEVSDTLVAISSNRSVTAQLKPHISEVVVLTSLAYIESQSTGKGLFTHTRLHRVFICVT